MQEEIQLTIDQEIDKVEDQQSQPHQCPQILLVDDEGFNIQALKYVIEMLG